MKQEPVPDLDRLLDRAIADGRRHRADAERHIADAHRLDRFRRFYTVAVMCFCMSATSLILQASVSVPAGRDMRCPAGVSHSQVFSRATLYLQAL